MTAAVRLVGVTAGRMRRRLPDPYRTLAVDDLTFVLRPIRDVDALAEREAATDVLSQDLSTLSARDGGGTFILFRLDALARDDAAVREIGRSIAASAADIISHMATYEERRLSVSLHGEVQVGTADASNFLQAASRQAQVERGLSDRFRALERDLAALLDRHGGQIDLQTIAGKTGRHYALLVPQEKAPVLETDLADLLAGDAVSARLSPPQPIFHFAPAALFAEAADA